MILTFQNRAPGASATSRPKPGLPDLILKINEQFLDNCEFVNDIILLLQKCMQEGFKKLIGYLKNNFI